MMDKIFSSEGFYPAIYAVILRWWVKVNELRPERGRSMRVHNEVIGNDNGSYKQCWRANRLREMRIVVKD